MCGGKDTQAQEAERQARKSYELQLEMFRYQKEQAEKLEKGKEAEEVKKAARAQMLLDIKRTGRSTTLTTIKRKPGFEAFKAKQLAADPEAAEEDIRKAYGQITPFARRALGTPVIKRKKLYA